MVKCRVVYAKSAVLSSPINKVLDLQKCIDCLRNYARMYGCYLTQCVLYRVATLAVGYSPPSIYYILLLSVMLLSNAPKFSLLCPNYATQLLLPVSKDKSISQNT